MDEIFLSRNRTKAMRLAIRDAIDEGTVDALGEQIMDAFTDVQIEGIESHLDGQSLEDVIEESLEEWVGDDEFELIGVLENRFSEAGLELKLWSVDEEDLEDDSFGAAAYDESSDDTDGDEVPLGDDDEEEERYPADDESDDED